MKEVSARKYMTIVFSTTYCLAIIGSIVLVIIGKLQVETFLGLLTGFTTITILIAEWYFKRGDRNKGGSNGKKDTDNS